MLRANTAVKIEIPQDISVSNMDELLSHFNQPREDFTPKTPKSEPTPAQTQATAGQFYDPYNPPPEEQRREIDPEAAARSGRRIAKIIDNGFAIGAGLYTKAPENSDKYKADSGDLQDLSEAWADMAQEYNLGIPPWLNLAFLNITTYFPKVLEAQNDRRFNKLNEKIAGQEERLKTVEKQIKIKEDEKNETN